MSETLEQIAARLAGISREAAKPFNLYRWSVEQVTADILDALRAAQATGRAETEDRIVELESARQHVAPPAVAPAPSGEETP